MRNHPKMVMVAVVALVGGLAVGIRVAHAQPACPPGANCGTEQVNGLGDRKKQLLGAGANQLDLAVAMLETNDLRAGYAYGDNKRDDAANFGIFKQNWGMIRASCGQFAGKRESDWNAGAVLNNNLAADIACLHASQRHYGLDRWFAGHRNGSSGLANPNTPDIRAYQVAIRWIEAQLKADPASLGNDVRYWVYVKAI